MKTKILAALVLLLIGGSLLVVGGNAYASEASVGLCMACGMKVTKSDPSTLVITSPGQPEQYACCPVCAAQIGLFFKDATIKGTCIASGQPITMTVKDGELSSTSPASACMLAGGSCVKNKLAYDDANAAVLKGRFDWASAVPVKTPSEFFATAKAKLTTMTLSVKPATISASVLAMLGAGSLFVAAAPVAYVVIGRREKQSGLI